ncbi:F0F1 ATP synthase subunit epsilon [Amaricoccus sp.]|uniref:F0F1 ATP synthase subunit epsilon n=1 Tax=Amaricoccus sp. TaxID=1872485 RepID=UPI0026051C9F|nr:F0F1 ATP synthase subunit epsilon [uncultured Amaricoccus sp.]
MADTMQFDLVSPERKLASLAATSVQIPAMDGDMTAMPNHAPFLTTLRPGIVRVAAGTEVAEFVVTGGFAEVSSSSATILAEQAVPRAEVSGDLLSALLSDAEKAVAGASEDNRIAAAQRLRDVTTLQTILKV